MPSSFSKRLHDALDDIEAELDVLSDEDNLEASASQFESLFLAEERLRHARKRLHRILGRKEVGPVIGGTISSEDHPVVKLVLAKARRRRNKAAKLRRSFLKVV